MRIWLDVTRLVTRVGRGPFTGIDRVEWAYLMGLLERPVDLFGFARTATGFVLLDRAGLDALAARIDGREPWGPPDLEARLSRRLDPERRRAEADLRRLAIKICYSPGLERYLCRHVTPGTWLVNVGHSNLTDRVLSVFDRAGARIAVMVHDTIPLEFPDLHRPGMPASFAKRMAAVAAHADLILTPSQASLGRIRRHLGSGLPIYVAPLGSTDTPPDPVALAERLRPNAPYFVTLGTIDGRKNQTLLLDLWERLEVDRPALYLVGSRGWCPPELARRLDALPRGVAELAGLSDGAVAALVEGAAGLLHPSLAEGYGLTLLEATDLGTPVVAADLPVYRETLGDIGVYLPPDDLYQWERAVGTLAEAFRRGERQEARRTNRPTWDAHLNLLLSKL